MKGQKWLVAPERTTTTTEFDEPGVHNSLLGQNLPPGECRGKTPNLDRADGRLYITGDSEYTITTNIHVQEEKMKVKPIGDRVLLSTEAVEEKTKSGLFIPQTAQEKTQTGVVVAVGDDKDVITVKKGDRVMYDKYAGTTVEIDGKEHLIIKMADVIATID